jgi:hypothetical protein
MNPDRQEAESARSSKPTRADRRWTLLFLGSRGKTVTFHHFKAAVFTAILVLLASTAVSAWFWYQHRSVRSDNRALREEIENMKQAVASVRDEKDILTARLVVAESRVAELMGKSAPAQKLKESQASSKEPVKKPETALSVIEKPEPPLNVDVRNFIVYFEPDINTLRVEYKLLNTGRKGNPVSGRTMVIMKEDEKKPDDWLVMPPVPLVDNRPKGNRGKYFSINRFRTVRFKANDQIGPDQYKSAAVFVFSSNGTLLLEKVFPVGIQSKTLTIVERAAPRPAPVKPKPPAPQKKKPQPEPTPPAPPSTAAPQEAPPGEPDAYETPANETQGTTQSEPEEPPQEEIRLP